MESTGKSIVMLTSKSVGARFALYVSFWLVTLLSPAVGFSQTFTQISAGNGFTCGLTNTQSVMCWGKNTRGQLGDDSTAARSIPRTVSGINGEASAVSAGNEHACAVVNGGLRCWGSNFYGQLGSPSATIGLWRFTPVPVTGLASGVVAVSTGDSHTCAIVSGGAAKCWGRNYNEQLGDGTSMQRETPTAVVGLSSGVQSIVAGDNHTCALVSNVLKCWGANASGQLGINNDPFSNGASSSIPVNVSGVTTSIVDISTFASHTCLRNITGGIACWGYNWTGQLGRGAGVYSYDWHVGYVPTFDAGSGALQVSAGRGHSCAVASGGSVWCWGDNSFGQLGRSPAYYPTNLPPAVVAGLPSGIKAVTAGEDHSCALTQSGEVWCWGRDGSTAIWDWVPTHVQTNAATVPGAPNIGTATAGNAQVTLSFSAPTSDGGSPITSYTATCGSQFSTGTASPLTVVGLTNGVTVTCSVRATNAVGTGAVSSSSNSVTPSGAAVVGVCGTAAGGTFSSVPAANLCSSGSASTVSGGSAWNWTCYGSNGGINASCSANLPAVTYGLQVSSNVGGTTTPSGYSQRSAGEIITVSATPNSGYAFSSWTGYAGCGVAASCTFTMPASTITVSANFTAIAACTYSLSPASTATFSSSGGTGSFSVITQSGCAIAAPVVTATGGWLSAALSGSTVNFVVSQNSASTSRSGSISVGSQVMTISQSGATASASCGLGTQLGPWRAFGTVSREGTTGMLTAGDSVGYDSGDSDGDCNPAQFLTPAAGPYDVDVAVYSQSYTQPVSFAWAGCIGSTTQSYTGVGLAFANPLFTGIQGSNQWVVGQWDVAFMTRWEYPGQLFVYSTETGTYVGRQVPSAGQSADGMCGAFEVRTANGQNSAYFNGALVYQAMSANASAARVPYVHAYDTLITVANAVVSPVAFVQPVNGVCGSANGGTFAIAPTANLCSSGVASSVVGASVWYWSCYGTDGGTTQNYCSASIAAAALPDLIVTNASVASTSILPGARIGTSVTVINVGNAAAAAGARLSFYWSIDTNITTSDIDSGWACTISLALIPGQSDTCSGEIDGPPSAGIYYFGTYVNADRAIQESNYSNNTTYAPTPVVVGVPPPLAVSGLCGSANGAAFAVPPTTNLCASGSASGVSGNGQWSWSCYGSNGGSSQSCSASMASSTQVKGLDISHYSGSVNGVRISTAGNSFVYVKASSGRGAGPSETDAKFLENIENLKNAGLKVGAYHFAYPEYYNAADEANHFLSVGGNYIGEGFLPPVLDIEDEASNRSYPCTQMTTAKLVEWINKWTAVVEAAANATPLIYVNGSCAEKLSVALGRLVANPLWIAAYSDPAGSPSRTGSWGSGWTFHQYQKDDATVPGVTPNKADKNVFKGTLQQLQALTTRRLPSTITMVEYYYSPVNYYFVTARPDEISLLDRSAGGGWSRTGKSFSAYASQATGSVSVNRYYFDGVAVSGQRGSHFYSTVQSDKDALAGLNPSNLQARGLPYNEGIIGYVYPPILGQFGGYSCAAGQTKIYRVFRGQARFPGDPNHRFTADVSVYNTFVAAGWDGEGVSFCAPL